MCENKIQLKSELSWKKCKDYISVYSDNRLLQKNIIQNDSLSNDYLSVDDIFNFLLFLKEPRSKRELAEYKDINKKDKESIITLLEKEQYVKKAGDDSRLNRFVSSFPYTDYELFKSKLLNSNILIIVALGYEISVLGGQQSKFLDRIKSYTKDDNEIKEIIADHVCHDRPLKTLKYYHAIAETAPLFDILEEGQGATHA